MPKPQIDALKRKPVFTAQSRLLSREYSFTMRRSGYTIRPLYVVNGNVAVTGELIYTFTDEVPMPIYGSTVSEGMIERDAPPPNALSSFLVVFGPAYAAYDAFLPPFAYGEISTAYGNTLRPQILAHLMLESIPTLAYTPAIAVKPAMYPLNSICTAVFRNISNEPLQPTTKGTGPTVNLLFRSMRSIAVLLCGFFPFSASATWSSSSLSAAFISSSLCSASLMSSAVAFVPSSFRKAGSSAKREVFAIVYLNASSTSDCTNTYTLMPASTLPNEILKCPPTPSFAFTFIASMKFFR